MNRQAIATAVVAFGCQYVSATAFAQDHSTYDAFRRDVEEKNCPKTELPDFTMFQCEKEMTFYYFTKPNHPAHPGVVERVLTQKDGAFYVTENGRSFAPDAAQPAFKAWLEQFQQLDARMRAEMSKQRPSTEGTAPPSP
jgi:hypothetical protein